MQNQPYGGKVIKNLLCHVWPVKGRGVWQWNVQQLLRRMDQFNGQRIVSVVTDDQTDTIDDVRKAFAGTVKDLIHHRNDPVLGESVSFTELLSRVENIDPRQLTFYCHAKGVKYETGTQPMVRPWTWTMYSSMLDYPHLIEDALRSHTLAGTFFKTGNQFNGLPKSFHFAGTFFWMRNKFLFAKDNWNYCAKQWWGSEAWPGVVCRPEEVATMLFSGIAPDMKMYTRQYWRDAITPVWNRWQVAKAPLRRHHSYAEVLNALRLKGAEQVLVTGPQRSGTTIAAKMLAADLKLPYMDERAFDTHDFEKFTRMVHSKDPMVLQCPTMTVHCHLMPPDVQVVWMRRNLIDVLRSQERIGWTEHEQLERDRYFDHSQEPAAVLKTRAWESHQRILLGEQAFDLDYESLRGHKFWTEPENRVGFADRQTCPHPY